MNRLKFNVIHFDELDSTNTKAKELALADTEEFTVVIADRQTIGRGRGIGRKFFSEGGLYMSVILRPDMPLEDLSLITLYTAVCVHKAIGKVLNADVSIKWVNDIMYKGGKVCGILCESSESNSNPGSSAIVVGIGINLRATEFPEEIAGIASCFDVPDSKVESVKQKLVKYIVKGLSKYNRALADRKFLTYYRMNCNVIDKQVNITGRGEDYVGVVLGVSDNGELMVFSNRGAELLSYGEVSVRELVEQ